MERGSGDSSDSTQAEVFSLSSQCVAVALAASTVQLVISSDMEGAHPRG